MTPPEDAEEEPEEEPNADALEAVSDDEPKPEPDAAPEPGNTAEPAEVPALDDPAANEEAEATEEAPDAEADPPVAADVPADAAGLPPELEDPVSGVVGEQAINRQGSRTTGRVRMSISMTGWAALGRLGFRASNGRRMMRL